MAGLGFSAPAHRAPDEGGDRIRRTQTPGEQASAAPKALASSPLRPVRVDTRGTPATPESLSILYASTAECSQNVILLKRQYLAGLH